MDMALWVAKTGLEAQHHVIEGIGNNLANVNTTAFKRNRMEFKDLTYQVIKQTGAPTTDQTNSPNGIVVGTGVGLASNKKIFTDGNSIQTNNPNDVAIVGRGFLKIEVPNSPDFAYTRAGNLTLNEQGQLVTSDGYLIQPTIAVPQGTVRIDISLDGIVSAINTTSTTPQQLGQLEMVDFVNTSGLLPVGDNLYTETVASGQPVTGVAGVDGFGVFKQGTLESSNVNVVEEMVSMIEAQRNFELLSKTVSTVDNMLQDLNRATA